MKQLIEWYKQKDLIHRDKWWWSSFVTIGLFMFIPTMVVVIIRELPMDAASGVAFLITLGGIYVLSSYEKLMEESTEAKNNAAKRAWHKAGGGERMAQLLEKLEALDICACIEHTTYGISFHTNTISLKMKIKDSQAFTNRNTGKAMSLAVFPEIYRQWAALGSETIFNNPQPFKTEITFYHIAPFMGRNSYPLILAEIHKPDELYLREFNETIHTGERENHA